MLKTILNLIFAISIALCIASCGNRNTVPMRPAPPSPPVEPATNQTPSEIPTQSPTPAPAETKPTGNVPSTSAPAAPQTAEVDEPGGYYIDDGPHANPQNVDNIPNAVPRKEALSSTGNKPYVALGQKFVPMRSYQAYKETGVGSWYGKRFHGRKTSSGEIYDMYSMTAAHPTLPIPSYAKVTNPANGRSVIVRVNDRGPFKKGRLIDLSYAAAHKLGYINKGSTHLQAEAIDPNDYSLYAVKNQPVKTTVQPVIASTNQTASNNTISQFFVQAGAFKLQENADSLIKKIQNMAFSVKPRMITLYNNALYKVKLGPYNSRADADDIANKLRSQLNTHIIVTPY
jgi:rare lipoprotein A